MGTDVRAIGELVEQESFFIDDILGEIRKTIIGQETMIERMLVGLLTGGHVLLEGVPGLAKTLTVKSLCRTIDAHFQRIQFTPDLLPADVVGTVIYNQQRGEFTAKKGPLFANLILADEINRAPAKVQSALLEAMQELQITIGDTTYPLEQPFMVMATQNPIEQEGTYPLPEAQVDRFMLHVHVAYPNRREEREIMERMVENHLRKAGPTSPASPESPIPPPPTTSRSLWPNTPVPAGSDDSRETPTSRDTLPEVGVPSAPAPSREPRAVSSREQILRARDVIRQVYVDDKIKDYVIDIVTATRDPRGAGLGELADMIAHGASPRASIALNLAARAHAFIRHRGYVTPEDIKAIGPDVLRHRIIRTYEAEAEEITGDDIVRRVFEAVEVP